MKKFSAPSRQRFEREVGSSRLRSLDTYQQAVRLPEEDGPDVHGHEDGGQATQPAVQVEHAGRSGTVAQG